MSTLWALTMAIVVITWRLLFLYWIVWFVIYMLGAIGVYQYVWSIRQLVWLLIAISVVYSMLFKVKW